MRGFADNTGCTMSAAVATAAATAMGFDSIILYAWEVFDSFRYGLQCVLYKMFVRSSNCTCMSVCVWMTKIHVRSRFPKQDPGWTHGRPRQITIMVRYTYKYIAIIHNKDGVGVRRQYRPRYCTRYPLLSNACFVQVVADPWSHRRTGSAIQTRDTL